MGIPLLVQCAMRRRTGKSAPSAFPVQLMAAKNILLTNQKSSSFFIFGPPLVYYLKAFLIFLTQNSILFCLSSIFVGSCLNLTEVRQCRMQVCPAYRDQG